MQRKKLKSGLDGMIRDFSATHRNIIIPALPKY
jgi:hypothetical protein